MNECFPIVESWYVPQNAFRLSMEEMAIDGRCGNEGVALWLGSRSDGTARVTHVLRLRGHGVVKKPEFLMIDSDLMNEVTDATIELGVQLIGQIHSHGPWHSLDLSATDLRFGIAVPGYLSVVAPDYALQPNTTFHDCGVHVCQRNRRFRRLPSLEIESRFMRDDDETVAILTIGESEDEH
jgi:proteasome lid subunit RPN8/RPN11